MPGKKADSKKGSSKKKEKKSSPLVITSPKELVKRLMRTYQANCEVTESAVSARLIKMMEKCIEDDTLCVQFIIESKIQESKEDFPVKLEPLIKALRSLRYTHVKDLYVWSYFMAYETVATLSTFIALSFYPIRTLELRDCVLGIAHMKRFSSVLPSLKHLTSLNLDYNEFGNDGCWFLCEGLNNNAIVLSLSLCYCDLGPECGPLLNEVISTSAIRDVYLDGNHLDCEGSAAMLIAVTDMANHEEMARAVERRKKLEEVEAEAERKKKARHHVPTSAEDVSKKEEKPKKAKEKTAKKDMNAPRFGPWIRTISLADNDIDNLTQESEKIVGLCMRSFAA